MMIAIHGRNDERFEAAHYRRLADSVAAPEQARLLKELADTCERKAALLQEIEERRGP